MSSNSSIFVSQSIFHILFSETEPDASLNVLSIKLPVDKISDLDEVHDSDSG